MNSPGASGRSEPKPIAPAPRGDGASAPDGRSAATAPPAPQAAARPVEVVAASAGPARAASPAPGPSDQPLLVAEGLAKRYRMGRSWLEVLCDCSLRLHAGEFVAIVGKSGSGKSTLLHILGALDVPQAGQVFCRGEPVFPPPEQRRFRTGLTDVLTRSERRRIQLRRTQFGFVFQFYHLLPELNVLENVLLARMVGLSTLAWMRQRRQIRREAIDLLARVGLAERIRHRPGELSGGERQRAAIARALIHRPPILLADEPTGNLDAESGRALLSLLRELHAAGQTMILVTHDPSVARCADRILRLEDGRLHPA